MELYEKLDFLMQITQTKNSALSRAVSFDASYISRIRAGKRGIPKNQPFLEPAAAFFARNLREPYQRRMAAELLCPDQPWPEQTKEAEDLLLQWLYREDTAENAFGEPLAEHGMHRSENLENGPESRGEPVEFYYGNRGKRQAVERFLSQICLLEEMPTLLLHSNEEFDWLYEDQEFAKRWAGLLMQVIQKGGRIKIIHTISRGANDMLVALQKWMPLYMSGTITPYFYPKLRDRVFRRTLFIASGHSAIVSNSVGTATQKALNLLIRDPQAVQALEAEFQEFFARCKPLMRSFNFRNRDLFRTMLHQFETNEEVCILAQPVPSCVTMPLKTAKSLTARSGNPWLLKRREDGRRRFAQQLELGHSVTEILHLPDPDLVRQGKVMVPMCDLFDGPDLYYTPEEFQAHLEHLMDYIRQEEQYHVVLSETIPSHEIICVKDDLGAMVIRAGTPTSAFGISEPRMTSALWGYLERIAEEEQTSRSQTLKALESYIHELQTSPNKTTE